MVAPWLEARGMCMSCEGDYKAAIRDALEECLQEPPAPDDDSPSEAPTVLGEPETSESELMVEVGKTKRRSKQ